MQSNSRPLTKAFTLIELLVVIAIIAILAAILFPVFARAREKARQSTCQSNIKQILLGIIQYTQDYDESMPLSISGKAQIGPVVSAASGLQQFSVAQELMPYVKSQQLFQCPDDHGFNGYTGSTAPTAGGQAVPNKAQVWEAYGTSYKFTKENFSQLPTTWPTTPTNPTAYTKVGATNLLYPAGSTCLTATGGTCTGGVNPPFPMTVAFQARPSEQRVIRDYVAPWDAPISAGKENVFHDTVDVIGFMDGHAKNVISQYQYDSYCDGATFSPIRKQGIQPTGDGSCNTSGLERNN